jgi:hypothetical protein
MATRRAVRDGLAGSIEISCEGLTPICTDDTDLERFSSDVVFGDSITTQIPFGNDKGSCTGEEVAIHTSRPRICADERGF